MNYVLTLCLLHMLCQVITLNPPPNTQKKNKITNISVYYLQRYKKCIYLTIFRGRPLDLQIVPSYVFREVEFKITFCSQ